MPIKAVNARIDEQTGTNRKPFADQKLVIDTLAERPARRAREGGRQQRAGWIARPGARRAASVGDRAGHAASRGARRRSGGWRAPVDPAAQPRRGGGSRRGAAAVGASPQKLLDSALADYYAGQYDLAILGFESYMKTFPQSPQASFAQLHVGNSQMQLGKYEPAIAAFDTVIRNYPRSNEVPDAYVRKGTALKTLRQPDKAREAFEFVIKNYPDSVAATVAQQRLQELLSQKP